MSGDWAWRLPFTLQWIWPAILITGVFWAPESPWWLVRKGRIEEAKRTLVRTASKGYWDSENRNIDAYIAVIQHTDELERAEAASGSFREMWKGTNRRRTEVEMGCWAIQVWSGTAMTAYAVQFLQSAGMNTVQSFNFNIIITAMNLVGVPIDFVLMRFFGRRPLIIFGLMSLAAALAIIGAFGCVPATVSTLTGIGACCAFINLAYHASVGPLTYTVASEVPASRLRAKTLAWGRAFYVINYNATAQLTPRMVAAGGWGWGSKAAFFWLGGNLLITLWAFFRLPETGGLSFADLDILFANKVSARKFKSTKIVNEVTMEQKVEAIDDKMEVEHVEAPRAVLT
jgi:SP family general alpha glucoside:H+ symporter-like MFS transporter